MPVESVMTALQPTSPPVDDIEKLTDLPASPDPVTFEVRRADMVTDPVAADPTTVIDPAEIAVGAWLILKVCCTCGAAW